MGCQYHKKVKKEAHDARGYADVSASVSYTHLKRGKVTKLKFSIALFISAASSLVSIVPVGVSLSFSSVVITSSCLLYTSYTV